MIDALLVNSLLHFLRSCSSYYLCLFNPVSHMEKIVAIINAQGVLNEAVDPNIEILTEEG